MYGQRTTRHDLTKKIQSNDSFKKEKERKKSITVYLNNKTLDQVTKMKYLGIILDHKIQ